jgi:hypothetical protein
MKVQTPERTSRTTEKPIRINHRKTERVPAEFNLMYSGMHDGNMLIGNGIVTNVSESGIGIRANHIVNEGMDLSLFINLPGIEEPLCIAESRVSWISSRRFGVEMLAPKLEAQNQLQFYVWNHLFRPTSRKS